MNRFLFQTIQVLYWLDQGLNVFVGFFTGGGYADELLSAKAYRMRDRGWRKTYLAINFIFFWQANHCMEAFTKEYKRLYLPLEYRS